MFSYNSIQIKTINDEVEVRVKHWNGSEDTTIFSTHKAAEEFIFNQPSDYYVHDLRTGQNSYVSDFRNYFKS